jgi:hypothetical protein
VTFSTPSGAATKQTYLIERAASLLEARYRHLRVAGRQHRVAEDNVALGQILRQFQVILDRLQGSRIAVDPDMPHSGRRQQVENAIAGAQDSTPGTAIEPRVLTRAGSSRHYRPSRRSIARGSVAMRSGALHSILASAKAFVSDSRSVKPCLWLGRGDMQLHTLSIAARLTPLENALRRG